MTGDSQPLIDQDFDVGPRGISGHYDMMFGRLQSATPKVVFALAFWAWVFTWPLDAAFFNVGPVLTFANILELGLAAWTAWVLGPLFVAVWHWGRWQALEGAGLKTLVRNDHRLRLISFRRSDGRMLFDQTTQQTRREQERTVVQNRGQKIWRGIQRVIIGFAAYLALPIGLMLLPRLAGHHFYLLTEPLHIASWARSELAQGHVAMGHWLSRADVETVLGALSIEGVAMWLIFYRYTVPRICELGWCLYDSIVYRRGHQYIPGARVFEPVIAEKTLDTLREQQVHGGTARSPLGEAARRMSE